ncbi:unnamed protein product [Malus baccata var. baccata]
MKRLQQSPNLLAFGSLGELVRALGGAVASTSLLGVPLGHNSSFLQGPTFAPPRIREAIWCGSTNSTTEEVSQRLVALLMLNVLLFFINFEKIGCPARVLIRITHISHGDMVEKSTAILQEATSQLPPETPIEDIIVPKDADVQIVTEVLDQKFGRRHGKVVRCTGKAGVRETGASSSKLSTGEVNSLKEEVTTLRGQVAAQGERMNMILQALAMSGLQIPTMPAPNVAPPSTSQPFRPDDTE